MAGTRRASCSSRGLDRRGPPRHKRRFAMSMTADKLSEAYFEKARGNTTWSGLPLKELYNPDDAAGVDYAQHIADPGQFPFTRGIHANMYRGKYWTRREVCGFGSAADTNKRFMLQM